MQQRILEIDALRGIAAVAVSFIFHQHYLTGDFQSGPLDGLPVFTWLHDYGWTMVDLFFVISGFIFARVYLTGDKIAAGAEKFARARFARLYPLHLLTLLLAAGIFAAGTPHSVTYATNDAWNFLLNLLMLQESRLQQGKSFNIPSWSISVEVFCYIAFYLIASRARASIYRLAWLVCLASVLATVSDSGTVDHIARGFAGFFAGFLAERHASMSRQNILLLSIAGLAILQLSKWGLSLGALMGVGIYPAMVIAAPRIGFLAKGIFTWLGDRSYSIYLIHAPVYMGINVFLFDGMAIPDYLLWQSIAGAWIAILVLSDLSFRKFETPMRRWLSKARKAELHQAPSLGPNAKF